jgi:hypothetical protein
MYLRDVHRLRFIRDLFCLLGRHDYEALSVSRPDRLGRPSVYMRCFYCGHQKRNWARGP